MQRTLQITPSGTNKLFDARRTKFQQKYQLLEKSIGIKYLGKKIYRNLVLCFSRHYLLRNRQLSL